MERLGQQMKNRTLRFGFALAIALTASLVVAQTKTPTPPATQLQKQQVVEVTKVDFLTMPKGVSTSLSTFGVSLGMTRQEAFQALKSFCLQCSIQGGPR
jgi:hypothetical protein